MHKPLFQDLCREVAAGQRSFEEWVRSYIQHEYQLYYTAALQWMDYRLRCEQQLQHPRDRSHTSTPAASAAAGQPPVQQPASQSHVQQQQAAAIPAAVRPGGEGGAGAGGTSGSKLKQASLMGFARPTPPPPRILESSAADPAQGPSRPVGRAAAAAAAAAAPVGQSSSAASAAAAGAGSAAKAADSAAAAAACGTAETAAAAAGAADSAAAGTAKAAGAAAQGGSKRKAAVFDKAAEMAGFGSFDDLEGWAGVGPSAASVTALFITKSKSAVAVACYKLLRVGGKLAKGDHNFKFTSHVRKDGQTVYAAVFTLMNEFNQIMAQYLVEDTSWDALVPKIEATCQRLERLGLDLPHTVYLDNTTSSENSIRAAMPGLANVQEDHYHAMRRVTTELPDDLPEKPIIIGMVKNALLPIYEEDRRKLREYCTKEGCGIGLKKDKQAAPAEQERRLRSIPAQFPHLRDPSSPGQLLFREGGPVLKALEQLILLVRAGKLSDVPQRLC
uniref:Uncharacterized protein n=1 Tax=Tetradesmus obliquus TaxID=3088 RepID=A0A383VCY3_TETOB|eukprot:jgi/Sobl393_1/779/SZX62504.1